MAHHRTAYGTDGADACTDQIIRDGAIAGAATTAVPGEPEAEQGHSRRHAAGHGVNFHLLRIGRTA